MIDYAVSALEREAEDTLRSLDLFTLPVEAFGSKTRPIAKRLHNRALWLLGNTTGTPDDRSPEQIAAEEAAIAEVEAEMERDFTFCANPQRLDEIHAAAGTMALRGGE